MDNFQKNLDVLEFSDSYFSNSVKILLVCQVLKVSTALNHILILPVYFLFYKTLCPEISSKMENQLREYVSFGGVICVRPVPV